MNPDKLYTTKKFHAKKVDYPLSPFRAGHILITQGEAQTPLCLLPLPLGVAEKGVDRQVKNAEMIRRLPEMLDIIVDVVVAREISQDEFKQLQSRCNRILKFIRDDTAGGN